MTDTIKKKKGGGEKPQQTFIGDQIHQPTGQASLAVLWRAQSRRRREATQRPQRRRAELTFSSCLAH